MIFENIIYSRYGNDLGYKVISKMQEIADMLGVPSDWISAVCWKESREKSTAVNKSSDATGFIQFMPNTAISLGTSVLELYNMSPVDQLDYVYKYFSPYIGKIRSYCDLYLITFFPAAVGKQDDYILETSKLSAYSVAHGNPGIDLNKDGQITVGEFNVYCMKDFTPDIISLLTTYTEIYSGPLLMLSGLLLLSLLMVFKYSK